MNNTFKNNSHGITGGDSTLVLNNIFTDHNAIAVKGVDAGTASYDWQGTTVLDLPPGAFSGAAPDIGAFEFEGAPR